MKIALAQINPRVGDCFNNQKKILAFSERAYAAGASLVIFPELVLTGYPPLDLLLIPEFMHTVERSFESLLHAMPPISALIGLPRRSSQGSEKPLHNSAAMIERGKLVGYADKILLPTYDVFDERRYFEPGLQPITWELEGERIGITICEDMWQHSTLVSETHYRVDPIAVLDSPSLVVNLSSSPYTRAKRHRRHRVAQAVCHSVQAPLLFCNQVGANDSLLFDGHSFYLTPSEGYASCQGFEEDLLMVETSQMPQDIMQVDPMEDLYRALVMGVRDYVHKTGHQDVCLGLSGGIDSAVVAVLAAAALGPGHVHALFLPSQFSSQESRCDAHTLAKNLGITIDDLNIDVPVAAGMKSLQELLGPLKEITAENLQARWRGIVLMAFSNETGSLLLSTGNKSEHAFGYTTLYGDLCGALSVIGDLLKTEVYALAQWINRHTTIIPEYTLSRPPSAELRPNQKDTDSLPPYEVIDPVIRLFLEEGRSASEISTHLDLPHKQVEQWLITMHRFEYKRHQAPLVLKVSEKCFRAGRTVPIVSLLQTS